MWYSHRQEWQRKVSSRLEGRLIKDVYTIATSHSETISGAKKLAVEAEVNALVASLSVGYEGSSDFTIKQSESFSQQVEVEFYPMSEYKKTQASPMMTGATDVQQKKTNKNNRWTVIALVVLVVILAVVLGVVLLK